MQKKYLIKIQLLFVLLITCVAFSQAVKVSDDAYVRGSSTYNTVNYDGQTLLIKSTNNAEFRRRAYMKFDLSDYTSVTSAILNFSGKLKAGEVPFTITIYSIADVDDSWSETTITDSTDPDLTALPVTFATGSNTDYELYAVDLTTHVQAELSSGNKIVSIGFKDADKTNDQFEINHKEAPEDIPNNIITANITLTGATTLGVDNDVISEFALYPNPVQDSFLIKNSNSRITNVKIFSIDGNMIFNNKNVNTNLIKVDTSTFQSGVYFVQIINAKGAVTTKKLIKE